MTFIIIIITVLLPVPERVHVSFNLSIKDVKNLILKVHYFLSSTTFLLMERAD
jgi:hypothetical protein